MKKFDSRAYSISDFLEWNLNGLLQLSPDFQRRSVWSEKAKSFLIDTIIRGRPIPKILISQHMEKSRTKRIVVDGQQRLRAILGYINGDFVILKAHNSEFAGKSYQNLTEKQKNEILSYELGVDLLYDLTDEDLLDIFARINSYTVTLNNQEKLNAKYLGYFKIMTYKLGFKYVDYLIRSSILTKARVTRMAEAELAGDMLVSLVGGIQTNKNIEQYYKKYDDDDGPLEKAKEKYDRIMSFIGATYKPEDLSNTNWSRVHLFYTLFTSIGHCLYGIKPLKTESKCKLSENKIGQLRVCLDEISASYDSATEDLTNVPKDLFNFISHSRRATTDTQARVERAEYVCKKIRDYMVE